MNDKMMYKGNNVIGALMNVPIFVGTFSVMTDFAVLENMDDYRDEGMGDVIFGEPFLREVGIKTRRFEGMITIYNGNDEVTYQMVRSHPRFKHHTNEQCNKIPPLLKDLVKEISTNIEVKIDDKLHFVEEPMEIMDREVKKLKKRWNPIVKVHWNSRRGPEFTWEREDKMKRKLCCMPCFEVDCWFEVLVEGDRLARSICEVVVVNMDDPNITMEQYIQLEEEKARRHGQVYNWKTATYGKIWYDEDVHYLRSFEKEFPAIVYKDALTSE
ncbi:hypothetical protein Tco_0587564 [Tanacetum coccineum]